jgi:hypothetical protein
MPDLYTSLIGESPSSLEQQKALAKVLRRRRGLGELASLSGDKVLQSFAKDQTGSTDDMMALLQGTRQKDIDNSQTKSYQSNQIRHMDENLAEQGRQANMGDATQRRGQDMSLLEALFRSKSANEKTAPRLRVTDIKKLQDMGQDIGTMNGVMDYLNKGGKFGAIEVKGMPIPGARFLTNTLAANGIGTEGTKEAFRAKQSFDRLYTLAARNNLFGATLSENEQRSWNDANPSTRQTDAQIATAIPVLLKVMQGRQGGMMKGLELEGYSPEAIEAYGAANQLDLPVAGDSGGPPPSGAAPSPSAGPLTPRQKRIAEIKAAHGIP